MKKLLLVFIFFALAAGALFAQQLELKDVIVRSARGIENELPQKSKVAVLNFNSPTKTFSDYVIEELINELLEGGKVTIVDRQNLTAIMNEMKFQYSGYVSDESMVSIGKMIGAQYIISGALTAKETYYTFRIRIISVETATIQRQITSELKNDKQVASLLGGTAAPTSNVRDNWVSAEVSGGGHTEDAGMSFGARYERMFGPYVSLGANFFTYTNMVKSHDDRFKDVDYSYDPGNKLGIDAFIRFYPEGGKFFLGLALGYYDGGKEMDGSTVQYRDKNGQYKSIDEYYTIHKSGLAITGEFGWKIDVGKEGGFFVQPGFLGTFIVGTQTFEYSDETYKILAHHRDGDYFNGYWRFYLGADWAF